MTSVVTAMTTAISAIATDALNGIAAIVPVAAPVMYPFLERLKKFS